MGYIPQKDLYRLVEIFLANAGDEDIAPMLVTTGIDSDFLVEGSDLRQNWLSAQVRADDLKAAKEMATAAQGKAQKAAHQEIVRMAEMFRGELGHNKPLMNRLGLQPKSKGNNAQPTVEGTTTTDETTATDGDTSDTNEATAKKRTAPKGQHSLAADIARWRRLCAGAMTLTKEEQGSMTKVGWSPKRIKATAALVEAVAEADNVQQAAVQRKEAGTAEAGQFEKKLRRWYSTACRRAKNAIEREDPDNRDYWLKKLGLKPTTA